MTILHTQDGAPVAATNRLPVELHGPNGAPLFAARRLAADNLALPTAPDVLATVLAYDGGALDMPRTSQGAQNLADTTPILATALFIRDNLNGNHRYARSASQDGSLLISHLGVVPMLSNGATGDLQRGNTEGTLLASALRTADTTSADQTNHNARGVVALLNIGAASGTGGLVFRFQMKDPISGNYVDVNAAPTARTTAECFAYIWYPGASMAAAAQLHQANAAPLPRTWRVRVAHVDGTNYTYSVSYAYVV